MAMITICGYPSSGKTTRSLELISFLETKLSSPTCPPSIARLKVIHINDESLGISKSSYDDSRAEKPARATLLSAVTRHLNTDNIVIVDGMNYIKGSRYQMYCAAREMSVRFCTVFIAAPPDKCRGWNSTRPSTEMYLESTLDNLISRFEEPSSSARWDSPLFTIPNFEPPLNTPSPPSSSSSDAESIWSAITTSLIKPPNTATLSIPTSSPSYLTLLESTTTSLITSLLSRQSLSPLSGPTPLLLSNTTPPIQVTITFTGKQVNRAVCERLKRQFTKLNMHNAVGVELGSERIARLFAEYLEGNIS